jgi:hypothetical protein
VWAVGPKWSHASFSAVNDGQAAGDKEANYPACAPRIKARVPDRRRVADAGFASHRCRCCRPTSLLALRRRPLLWCRRDLDDAVGCGEPLHVVGVHIDFLAGYTDTRHAVDVGVRARAETGVDRLPGHATVIFVRLNGSSTLYPRRTEASSAVFMLVKKTELSDSTTVFQRSAVTIRSAGSAHTVLFGTAGLTIKGIPEITRPAGSAAVCCSNAMLDCSAA